MMLHAAQKMARSVVGLVGVAADPDFITDLVMPKLSKETKATIEREGSAEFEWGGKTYSLSKVHRLRSCCVCWILPEGT